MCHHQVHHLPQCLIRLFLWNYSHLKVDVRTKALASLFKDLRWLWNNKIFSTSKIELKVWKRLRKYHFRKVPFNLSSQSHLGWTLFTIDQWDTSSIATRFENKSLEICQIRNLHEPTHAPSFEVQTVPHSTNCTTCLAVSAKVRYDLLY